ncbi:S8 family peptidase [Verrucomicrobium sp. BvORR034]|uniref:S8 family peptidase n=1 Tax=Verrucomicrobium sp. BvORR034 TaxID=1396418 RepID=UPI0009DFB6E7|nr:S8 family peptidase [Verrucomicrobium sp. BvORR034]
MSTNSKRLILANGEKYIVTIQKKKPGRSGDLPRTYDEARTLVRNELTSALGNFASLPDRKRYDDEAVLCLRLHPERMAKSYDPKGLLDTVRDLENVGSRSYKVRTQDVAQTKRIKKQLESGIEELTGRLVFIRSNDAGFRRLLKKLDESERALGKSFCEDIQSIERFDLLRSKEQLLFPAGWKEGRVELVLHPTRHSEAEQMSFLGNLFDQGAKPIMQARPYPDGPTFISCYLSEAALAAIADVNPLRAAHPLVFGGLEDLRSAALFPAPLPPSNSQRSIVRVGIFDGGIDITNAHLKDHAEQDENLSIDTPPDTQCVAHGTAVAGAILYGALNDRKIKENLPAPQVSVVSVRALPTSSISDPDLYECIDVIENAVPVRNDVKFWNISFGPRGPIADDSISRFTYALDALAVAHKVGFCVAVGNDGDAGPDLNRIQAPSDLVNGLGVGAHTILDRSITHAEYSCHGPGRECGKLKPEVTAFGGCNLNPIHLLSLNSGQKLLTKGTSFASPQVASLAGQANGYIDRSSPLLARALVVHTATHTKSKPDERLGYGAIASNFDELVRCDANHVTIVFQKSLAPKEFVKLPIMLPAGLVTVGTATIAWTIACLPSVNALHPSDYTSACIEDTFYPNSQIHRISPPKGAGRLREKILHLGNDADELNKLRDEGWTVSELPVTYSPKYRTEAQKRAVEQKWEPLVKRVVEMPADSLATPFLVLHAIPRKESTGRLEFAAAVSITVPEFQGDLYDTILRTNPALQPVRLRSEAELRIQI